MCVVLASSVEIEEAQFFFFDWASTYGSMYAQRFYCNPCAVRGSSADPAFNGTLSLPKLDAVCPVEILQGQHRIKG